MVYTNLQTRGVKYSKWLNKVCCAAESLIQRRVPKKGGNLVENHLFPALKKLRSKIKNNRGLSTIKISLCVHFFPLLSSDFKPIKLKIRENHLNLSYAWYPLVRVGN